MGILVPAAAYVAIVFAAGFALGIFRVTLLAPWIGALAAVACELPLMVAASWLAAGWVLARWPLPGSGARLAMGAIAFALLMGLEAVLSLAFCQPLAAWAKSLTSPEGALGLAGQIGFALIPALHRSLARR